MKPLLCLLYLHDWHEHEVYSRPYMIPTPPHVTEVRDRICLRCGHENREASRLHARDAARVAKKIAAVDRIHARLARESR